MEIKVTIEIEYPGLLSMAIRQGEDCVILSDGQIKLIEKEIATAREAARHANRKS